MKGVVMFWQIENIGLKINSRRTMVVEGFVIAVLVFTAIPLVWPKAAVNTFAGEIQDSNCAATAEHVEKECALTCVRHGAKWVLYVRSKDEVYQLDDQERPAKFAAQQVTIVGTFDKSTRTIHVLRINGS
jgi:hypothetical protein